MCHALLHDPAFFRLLTRIDAEFAAQTRQGRCPECAGPLHVADFPRKPRSCPPSVRQEYSWRLSFTCGWCDTRSTPVSVRFFGRRVYVAVALMLVSPPAGYATRALEQLLSVPARTLRRWENWWQRVFSERTSGSRSVKASCRRCRLKAYRRVCSLASRGRPVMSGWYICCALSAH